MSQKLRKRERQSDQTSADYVCPMCPEVRVEKPGPCPSCGMALDRDLPAPTKSNTPAPCIRRSCGQGQELARSAAWRSNRAPSQPDEDNPELREMTRRFWISSGAYRSSVCHRDGRHVSRFAAAARPAHARWLPWIRIVAGDSCCPLGRLAIFSARLDLDRESLHQHVHADRDGHRRRICIQPRRDIVPANLSRLPSAMNGTVPVYFEAAAAITTLVLLGQVLELRARSRTGQAIRALLDLISENCSRLARRQRRRHSSGSSQSRRPAPGAARREDSG